MSSRSRRGRSRSSRRCARSACRTSSSLAASIGQPLHDLALLEVVKRLEPAQTAHGLRSTFRDWVGETTDFAGELAELALGHVVGGVEGRYRRGTAIDRRRALMAAWDAYLAGPPPADADNVLPFARSA